jgi:hypothetical protein
MGKQQMSKTSYSSTEQLPPDAPVFWEPRMVAKIARKSLITLARYRTLGIGPRWKRIGHHILYRKEDVLARLDSCPGGDPNEHP